MTTNNKEPLLHKWLRYSKRIAMIGIIQWLVIAMITLIIVIITMFFGVSLDEYTTPVMKNTLTASSCIAVSTASAYYAHSAYEKKIEQMINSSINYTDTEDENEEVQG